MYSNLFSRNMSGVKKLRENYFLDKQGYAARFKLDS